MNLLLAFLGIWLVVGLWAPAKFKAKGLILGATTVLIVFLLLFPRYL